MFTLTFSPEVRNRPDLPWSPQTALLTKFEQKIRAISFLASEQNEGYLQSCFTYICSSDVKNLMNGNYDKAISMKTSKIILKWREKRVLNKVYLHLCVVVYRNLLNVYYGHQIFRAATKITAFCFCEKNERLKSNETAYLCIKNSCSCWKIYSLCKRIHN